LSNLARILLLPISHVLKMTIVKQIHLVFALFVSKSVTFLVRGLKIGAASVLPGQVALKIYPRLLPNLTKEIKSLILVVGTNGKTTTSLLLSKILEDGGHQVVHNSTGANLINGLVTALIEQTDFWGKIKADHTILEVDENILPLLLKDCQPSVILALNLFRDQLDRYGEVDTISRRWKSAIDDLSPKTIVVLNADDPTLSYLGQQLSQRVLYFGLNQPEFYLKEIPHAVDSIYCPRCGSSLNYVGVYLSHLGDYQCPSCSFTKGDVQLPSNEWPQILIGVYNKYNSLAAATIALEMGIEKDFIKSSITSFKAAFGRAEELVVYGKKVRILLSKNPVGLNETIRTVKELQEEGKVNVTLLILNDRTPDGTDVSWIWDVDTENLFSSAISLVVSGDRIYDMALRLTYSQEQMAMSSLLLEENLAKALEKSLELTPNNETLHIIPTYSAMLEVRQLLTGSSIR